MTVKSLHAKVHLWIQFLQLAAIIVGWTRDIG